ncbi:hypothetical protein POF51_20470 [Brevibacillus sp. AG]|uniref:hypothetical protein n=1 Tax=Brevibacillus sp. AG TaxID=3020891 RepID=UPI000A5FCD8D|nr:hypothetical protein [Brevibacillus sp. AG]MDC0763096.1 hypothetical protein [Brevibacillus sp. AG]
MNQSVMDRHTSPLSFKGRCISACSASYWLPYAHSGSCCTEDPSLLLAMSKAFSFNTVPFVAWLAERKKHVSTARTGFIHLAGIAYLLGLAAIGWQTYLGRAVLEISVFPILAACCFLVAFFPIVFFLQQKNNAKNLHHTSDIQN